MSSLLRLDRKQKNSSTLFRIRIVFLLSYSFGIETINTFIHSRSSLENHTRFQTKMGKVYTRFQTKTAQKPYPMGRDIPIWLIYGSTPPEQCIFKVIFVSKINSYLHWHKKTLKSPQLGRPSRSRRN